MTINLTKDIVVSSRIRLARNLKDYNFPIRINDENDKNEITQLIYNAINKVEPFHVYKLSNMDNLSSLKYLEKHLISKELIDNKDIASFCVNKAEDIVVMINEEDHIRQQCVLKDYNLDLAYQKLSRIDDALIKNTNIAYSEDFGFLTACPSNIGTGMRASCMLFLPGLSMTGSITDIINTVSKLGLTVRGLYGEGSNADGYLYQISNQTTLGKSEKQIIDSVKSTVEKVCELENEARDILFQSKKDEIKDATYRAYGILSNSYIMTSEEFTKLLSQLKLGKSLGLIEFLDQNILDEIEVECQPANIMNRFGELMTPIKRDKFRADYLSKALKNQRI